MLFALRIPQTIAALGFKYEVQGFQIPVPEPSSAVLLISAAGVAAALFRRKLLGV